MHAYEKAMNMKNTISNMKTKGASRAQKSGFAPYLRPTRALLGVVGEGGPIRQQGS